MKDLVKSHKMHMQIIDEDQTYVQEQCSVTNTGKADEVQSIKKLTHTEWISRIIKAEKDRKNKRIKNINQIPSYFISSKDAVTTGGWGFQREAELKIKLFNSNKKEFIEFRKWLSKLSRNI